MKSLVLILLVSTYCLAGYGSVKEEPLRVELRSDEDALKLEFKIKSESPTNLVVTIRDGYRQVLFQRSYSGSVNYQGVVNMENLSNGSYYFEVRQGTEVYRQEINLSHETKRYVTVESP